MYLQRPNRTPRSKHLAMAARKNSPLTGRNLGQNLALGGLPSAWTGWSSISITIFTSIYRCYLRSFTEEIGYMLRVKTSSRTFNLWDCSARSSQLRRGLSLTPTGHRVHFCSVIRRLLSLTQRVTRAGPCRRLIHLNKAFLLL